MNTDILCFRKESQCFLSAFPPYPTALHPTKGCAQIALEPCVHPHDAAFEKTCNAVHARHVVRPHRCCESVRGAVRTANGLVFGIEGDDGGHRTEDLFLIDTTFRSKSLDERWCHEVSIGTTTFETDTFTTTQYRATFFASEVDVGEHLLEMLLADQCAVA